MSDKWDRFQDTVERQHDNLFGQSEYTATFYNYSGGSYDPNEGEITGETRTKIGDIQAEIVPPAIDSTVRVDGTSFSWDTSIRFPEATDSLTVESGETYTVEAGTTEQYATVTVESNATLTVNGSLLIYDNLNVNGTIDTSSGTVTIFGTDDFADSIKPLGEDNERPTEVEISDEVDNDSDVYELHGYSYEKGSGMIMARLVEQ
jgi:hypothetical protein